MTARRPRRGPATPDSNLRRRHYKRPAQLPTLDAPCPGLVLPGDPPLPQAWQSCAANGTQGHPGRRRRWTPLAVYATYTGINAGLAYHSHGASSTLVVIAITTPAVLALLLLTTILFGNDHTCDRAFRLLRWIANQPEPPQPPPAVSRHESGQPSHPAARTGPRHNGATIPRA